MALAGLSMICDSVKSGVAARVPAFDARLSGYSRRGKLVQPQALTASIGLLGVRAGQVPITRPARFMTTMTPSDIRVSALAISALHWLELEACIRLVDCFHARRVVKQRCVREISPNRLDFEERQRAVAGVYASKDGKLRSPSLLRTV